LAFGFESSKEFDGGTRVKNRKTSGGSRKGVDGFPRGSLVHLSAMSLEPVEKLARMEEIADLLYLGSAPFATARLCMLMGGARVGK
jgi:hypothetical protein